MMRALFSAISGMKNHMSYMDVVGNNIANVNTIAYKSSRATFQDILGQTVRGASTPQAGRGGTNPAQIGLGMQLGGIDNIMTQGSLQSTGKLTDFAVQGDGFFVVSDGTRNFYTRDGAFDIDVEGTLVNPVTGLTVMGWVADATGAVDTESPLQALQIPFGTRISAQATQDLTLPAPKAGMVMAGNLDAGTPTVAPDNEITTTVTAYDSLGNAKTIRVIFTKTATNTWDVTAMHDIPDVPGPDATPGNAFDDAVTIANGTLSFLPTGTLDTGIANNGMVSFTIPAAALGTGADPLAFTLDLTTFSQYAGASQSNLQSQTGSAAGALVSFAVGSTGEVTGIYSNGANRIIGQLALASFTNPGGLQRQGQNLWAPSSNSGEAIVGLPNTNGRGSVSTGTLESSNVDLAQQFTNVILAQRGFQSSSRVITAGDQMLQDLVNIIR
ncbi:MAG: flagellar hook protein FlgE [Dehalococcoidia bacterium]|uniref:flagellar hook protein FlgE n=2 Tax=Candidatus Amarobacter glycogenicus TaxID=3140699 RepID=UPI001D3A2230|nr:flagellar hook protein FlgE [Dehalococcoidia bacterium]MBK6560668.1 flagellar hook protein FlgE [Dehalococcoidia bacterium]MBK7124890.1 flagellar hook protein FlgE [Dehalococcoidia bacterium]MBK7723911.1 flagellar hook protein FlgE [Dehalococcoidia bacterium]MBK9545024.1 flagellar hook protein FlgE [Dehalococcoidia bacterium]